MTDTKRYRWPHPEVNDYIDLALENLFAGRTPDPLPLKKKCEILRDDYFELDVTLGGFCYTESSDPGTDYRGFTEINRIMLDGKQFDAREFPPAFVRWLERKLRS